MSFEHFIWDVLRLWRSFDQFFPKNREIFRDPRVISGISGRQLASSRPINANGAAVLAAPQFNRSKTHCAVESRSLLGVGAVGGLLLGFR